MDALKEGRQLLTERQKLIKIADRSEYGWGVVAEYTTDELAEDSDDEKRIEKAERAAEQKAAKRRKKKSGSITTGRPRRQPFPSAPVATTAPPSVTPLQFATNTSRRPGAAPAPVQRPLGPCFACGELGHLRVHCPKLAAAEGGRKWYPFDKGDSLYVHRVISPGRQPDKGCEVYCVSDEIVSGAPARQVLVDNQEFMLTSRLWEVGDEEMPTSVKGRLRNHIDFWREELQAPTYVLSTIESGYVLPLKSEPTPFVKKTKPLHSSILSLCNRALKNYWQLTVLKRSQRYPMSVALCQ
ncbi:MAG: hypothetical protein ETSY2_46335 [Candidatus Entotheonella gemina]|uniref:CCHC-type domain-containing protein n=1 Tax=Candidatus Entotheonella gemina TaxID=1429439 RepID=W4LGK6_9BACT|nr:MAG: hypothetical protein ETSY2_46335 [Candidatus Entotheonella gemina]